MLKDKTTNEIKTETLEEIEERWHTDAIRDVFERFTKEPIKLAEQIINLEDEILDKNAYIDNL